MPARFEARYSQHFLSDVQKLDPPIQRRILEVIENKLLIDPFKYGKKLVGKTGPGRWRFRVGDYRIRFDVEGGALLFYRVRHRRDIYE